MSKIFTYSHTVLVPYSAAQVYAVVDDVSRYAQFLPNCAGSGVLSRTPIDTQTQQVKGYMDLAFLGVRHRLDSDNTHALNSHIDMRLLKGPFKQLTGRWHFMPLGDTGCKVSLNMQWQYNNALLAITLGQRFEGIAKQLLDAFLLETAKRSA